MNLKYTFGNFIVNSQNELSHSVATAITKNLLQYNPFFVYGKWRSGKIHLLHAIRTAFQEKHKIFYVTGEEFYSDLVNSCRERRLPDFIKQYQNYDVVMIDNIEACLEEKTDTQKAVMEIIDGLLTNNKQVIVTYELNPADSLPLMYQYFISKYGNGIITEISAPAS